jgi:hypothetical protein
LPQALDVSPTILARQERKKLYTSLISQLLERITRKETELPEGIARRDTDRLTRAVLLPTSRCIKEPPKDAGLHLPRRATRASGQLPACYKSVFKFNLLSGLTMRIAAQTRKPKEPL